MDKVIDIHIKEREQLFSNYSYNADNLNPDLDNHIMNILGTTPPPKKRPNYHSYSYQ